MELFHYGVKGMKWGIRKNRNTKDGTTRKSLTKSGKVFVENKCKDFLSKPLKVVRLPKQEYAHVQSEVQTWMNKENMHKEGVFDRQIGPYTYTVYHDGKRNVDILSKRRSSNASKN